MKEKVYAALIAVVLVSSIGFAVSPSLVGEGNGDQDIIIEPEYDKNIYPIPYYNDYPGLVVLKGVAVEGENVEPAVFIGIYNGYSSNTFNFQDSYFIVDGKAYELDLEDRHYDSKTGTAILQFDAGSEDLTLVLKSYRINYRDVVVASGQFGDYILNMRLVGYEEPIYRAVAEKAEIVEETLDDVDS